MKKFITIIFSIIAINLCSYTFVVPTVHAEDPAQVSLSDENAWATDENRDLINNTIKHDLEQLKPNYEPGHVTLGARIGVAFMHGMSSVSNIIYSALSEFAKIFILVAFAFWVMMETYKMMAESTDLKKFGYDLVKKGILIAAWLIILNFGVQKLFMYIMGPIVYLGTFISNMIFDSVASVMNTPLPDNCSAISQYITDNIKDGELLISHQGAASLLCIPTHLTTFFMTSLGWGFTWSLTGIGAGVFSVIAGIFLIVLSIKNIFKYLFVGLGVVADLFLIIMMLPFTAIAETVANTSYKGIAGDILNKFLTIFNAEKLEKQINHFIGTTLHFIVLSMVVAVAAALLAFIFLDSSGTPILSPELGTDFVIITICVLALTKHFADKAEEFATKWSDKIDAQFGKQLQTDAKDLYNTGKNNVIKWVDIIRKSRNK